MRNKNKLIVIASVLAIACGNSSITEDVAQARYELTPTKERKFTLPDDDPSRVCIEVYATDKILIEAKKDRMSPAIQWNVRWHQFSTCSSTKPFDRPPGKSGAYSKLFKSEDPPGTIADFNRDMKPDFPGCFRLCAEYDGAKVTGSLWLYADRDAP